MFLLIYFLVFMVFYAVSRHLIHKVCRLPPSPFPILPVIGHLHLIKKPIHRTLAAISRRHGPILLFQFGSRRVLVVSSASAAEECLTKNDIIFANRPKLLAGKYLGHNYTNLVWTSYGDHWKNLRRIASLELLSTHRLNSLSGIRTEEITTLLRWLTKKDGDQDSPVNMKTTLFELMMNLLMRMISGKRYYGDNIPEVEMEEAKEFREIIMDTFRIGAYMNAVEFLPFLRLIGFKGAEKEMHELQVKGDKFMQGRIEQHKKAEIKGNSNEEGWKKNKTLIQELLSLQKSEPEYYKDATIRSLGLVLLVTGSDTSAATMEWAMSLLLNHPEVLKKARAELDSVVGSDRLVSESDLTRLPYLHCIICETLRMYPAVSLLVPHESSKECQVGGYRVPGGTMLMINLYSIQRDPKYWPEPNKFKPERFEGMEGIKDVHKMMPFGSGRRGCPGENLALRMVGATLGSLIQCFDWERVNKEPVDMTEGIGLIMPKALPLMAICRPRECMSSILSQI